MNLEAERQYSSRVRRAEDDLLSTRRMIKNIILTGSGEEAQEEPADSAEDDETE